METTFFESRFRRTPRFEILLFIKLVGVMILLGLSTSCRTSQETEASEARAVSNDRKSAFYLVVDRLEPSKLKEAMTKTLDRNLDKIQSRMEKAAQEVSQFAGQPADAKIRLAVDLYGNLLSFFMAIELPILAKIYEVEAEKLSFPMEERREAMKAAFGKILTEVYRGNLHLLMDYNQIPGLKQLSQLTRLSWPSSKKESGFQLSESSPKDPVLTLEDLAKPTPQVNEGLEKEAKEFKQAFNEIVPPSLMISSMLIGTAVAVIVTVATLNPAVGGGVGVATGLGILAFVGGSYGLVQTMETYKSQIHKTNP